MFGFINLNKPAGFTSHDCVAKLRKLLNIKKVGHGGTLDPDATGVLPVAIGRATRLLQFLPESKAYRARIRLGITTTTDDLSGEVIQTTARVNLEADRIIDRLNNFNGTIEQIPPIYSAIKKNGKKLYELARKGEQIELEPRKVTIAKIELIGIDRTNNEIEVDIDCGPGTYIRSIARDLGEQLGVGGTLASLVRTKSCGMQLDNSITFEQIETRIQHQTFSLIEPGWALNHLDAVILCDDDSQLWCQGQLIDLDKAQTDKDLTSKRDCYLATYKKNVFLGISILYERNNVLKVKPKIVCVP